MTLPSFEEPFIIVCCIFIIKSVGFLLNDFDVSVEMAILLKD